MTVIVRPLPMHPLLGRHVRHDDASRDYDVHDRVTDTALTSVRHRSRVGILDQGQVGACTGFSSTKRMTYEPFTAETKTLLPKGHAAQIGTYALGIYSDAETIDGDGPYPPNDNGSSGLTVAKVWKNRGLVGSYEHAFSTDDALRALVIAPWIMGIPWYEGMFTPDADGFVTPSGPLDGGHELCCDEINVEDSYIEGPNSWTATWGPLKGRYRMTFDVLDRLLSEQGDVTIFNT